MSKDILTGIRQDEIQKAIIANHFSNKDEVLKSDEQISFEDEVRKGVVEVVTLDEIKEDYNDQMWLKKDLQEIENNAEALIQKGEKDYLTQDEWDNLKETGEKINALERKAVAIQKGQKVDYIEVFVEPTTDEDDE